jgi:hypothetical protein
LSIADKCHDPDFCIIAAHGWPIGFGTVQPLAMSKPSKGAVPPLDLGIASREDAGSIGSRTEEWLILSSAARPHQPHHAGNPANFAALAPLVLPPRTAGKETLR